MTLIRHGEPEPTLLDQAMAIGALAFSADGSQLAVAAGDRVTLWKIGQKPEKLIELTPCRTPISLAWSPDHKKLALGQDKGGVIVWHLDGGEHIILPDYPAPVRSLAWTNDSDTLATSGAFRVIAWPLNQLKTNGNHPTSLDTGRPGLAAVESIASHPVRALDGGRIRERMLIIAQIGKQDELVIKTEGPGAIGSVKWSGDAGYIAVGSSQGLAAIVELPSQMFK